MRYYYSEKVGEWMCIIGFIAMLLSMCINIDKDTRSIKICIISVAVEVVIITIGLALKNLVNTESKLVAIFVVICAWMFRFFHRVPVFRLCFDLKKYNSNSYRRLYRFAKSRYLGNKSRNGQEDLYI